MYWPTDKPGSTLKIVLQLPDVLYSISVQYSTPCFWIIKAKDRDSSKIFLPGIIRSVSESYSTAAMQYSMVHASYSPRCFVPFCPRVVTTVYIVPCTFREVIRIFKIIVCPVHIRGNVHQPGLRKSLTTTNSLSK